MFYLVNCYQMTINVRLILSDIALSNMFAPYTKFFFIIQHYHLSHNFSQNKTAPVFFFFLTVIKNKKKYNVHKSANVYIVLSKCKKYKSITEVCCAVTTTEQSLIKKNKCFFILANQSETIHHITKKHQLLKLKQRKQSQIFCSLFDSLFQPKLHSKDFIIAEAEKKIKKKKQRNSERL